MDEHSPTALQTLNTVVLREFITTVGGNDREVANELIDLFLVDTPGTLDVLRLALEQGNSGTIYRVAHSLKPTCSQIGALRLAQLAQDLETISLADNLTDAAPCVRQIEREFKQVEIALEDFRSGSLLQ